MLTLLFLSVKCDTKVTNPPIQVNIAANTMSPQVSVKVTYPNLEKTLRTIPVLSDDQVTRFVKKMKFATENSILAYKFDMNINYFNPNARVASKSIYRIVATKNNDGTINLRYQNIYCSANVISQVITETSSTFLFWEYNKQKTIQWRPLTSKELDEVNNRISIAMMPHELLIRNKSF